MNKLSFAEAKQLSLLKWEQIVKDKGRLIRSNIPLTVKDLKWSCGFCERWKNDNTPLSWSCPRCEECEFGAIAGPCIDEHSIYGEWQELEALGNYKTALGLAKKILEIIKNLPDPEE